jgi:hypothetical protein
VLKPHVYDSVRTHQVHAQSRACSLLALRSTFTPHTRSTGSTLRILLVHPPSNLSSIHILSSIPASFLYAIYLAIPPSTSVLFFRFDHLPSSVPLLTPSPPPLPIPDPRPFHPRPPYSTCRRPHESLPSSTPFPFFRLVSSRDLEIRRPPAPGTRGERSECAREGGDYPEPWKQKLRWYDHRRTRRAVFPAPWSWRSGIAAGVAPPCRVAFPSRVAMSFIIIVFCRVCGHGQYRDAGVSV